MCLRSTISAPSDLQKGLPTNHASPRCRWVFRKSQGLSGFLLRLFGTLLLGSGASQIFLGWQTQCRTVCEYLWIIKHGSAACRSKVNGHRIIQIIQLNPQKMKHLCRKAAIVHHRDVFPLQSILTVHALTLVRPNLSKNVSLQNTRSWWICGKCWSGCVKKTKTGNPQFHGSSMSIYVHLCASELVGENAGAQWTWLDKRSQTLRSLRTVCEGAKSWSMERKASPSSSTTWLLCPPWPHNPHIDPFYGSKLVNVSNAVAVGTKIIQNPRKRQRNTNEES